MEDIFHRSVRINIIWIDNDAAKTSFQEGYSRKLRYVRKHQRVSLGFIKDSRENSDIELHRVDSGDNCGDVHTKPLERVAFQKHRTTMGVEECA